MPSAVVVWTGRVIAMRDALEMPAQHISPAKDGTLRSAIFGAGKQCD
jgi:hypothetical protein